MVRAEDAKGEEDESDRGARIFVAKVLVMDGDLEMSR